LFADSCWVVHLTLRLGVSSAATLRIDEFGATGVFAFYQRDKKAASITRERDISS
jgi:hypothetical protein